MINDPQTPQISQIIGFFQWPPVWIGETPTVHTKETWNSEVFSIKLESGIAVKVLKNGIFAFDFSDSKIGQIEPNKDLIKQVDAMKNARYKHIDVLNTYLLCLYTAIGREEGSQNPRKIVITPENTLLYPSFNLDVGMSFAGSAAIQVFNITSPEGVPNVADQREHRRSGNISLSSINRSFELLEDTLRYQSNNIIDLVQLLTRSCKAYEDHNFSSSLITAWAVTEKLLYVHWEHFLEELNSHRTPAHGKGKFINKDRKKRLDDSRNYSASVVTEILSLAGAIPASLYEDLNTIRSIRNNWIHELRSVDMKDAELAILVATFMLNSIYKLEFKVPLHMYMAF